MDYSYSKEFRTLIFSTEIKTKSTEEQIKIEELTNDVFYQKKEDFRDDFKRLFSDIHRSFCKSKLTALPESYESLDSSQTWIIYWTLHSLKLLNVTISDYLKKEIIKEINYCQSIDGGFGGGSYQLPHLATSYASVLALAELECDEAFQIINRKSLYSWLKSIRTDFGAFAMHQGGELDVRGCYCAVTIAKLTGIITDDLFKNTSEWVASCQTYEGGFGGAPGLEAHGGYSFCALACLILLGKVELIDIGALLKWSVNRQMSVEGGFQGRTNKLVDSCYSFWVGAIIPLVQEQLQLSSSNEYSYLQPLYDIGALEEYILVCCQHLTAPFANPSGGGFIDKPGKYPDPYHTCYSLSGLSVAQHYRHTLNPFVNTTRPEVEEVDNVVNITTTALKTCNQYFNCNNN